jgi:hypothetical protein
MLKSILATGIAGILLMSAPAKSAEETVGGASPDLEPAINGGVSASGLFPSQEMEEEFAAYLRWAKERGISRLAAFEYLIDGGAAHEVSLQNSRMESEFESYMRWVEVQDLSPFYAFMVNDFD